MGFTDILWSIFVVIMWPALIYLTSQKLGPFFTNYRFTEEGVDVVMFGGRIRVSRIPRQQIRDASVMLGLRARLQNPFAYNMINRFTMRVLLIRTTGWKSYILSPADPEAALRAIGSDASS